MMLSRTLLTLSPRALWGVKYMTSSDYAIQSTRGGATHDSAIQSTPDSATQSTPDPVIQSTRDPVIQSTLVVKYMIVQSEANMMSIASLIEIHARFH